MINKTIISIITTPYTKPKYFRIWIILFLFSVMGMIDLPSGRLFPCTVSISWILIIIIAFTKATFLSIIGRLINHLRFRYKTAAGILNVLFICFTVAVCLCCLVNFICFYFYGFGISNKLMAIIAQTNYDETAEFLPTFLANLYSEIQNTATWLIVIMSLCLILFADKLAPIGIIRSIIYAVSAV